MQTVENLRKEIVEGLFNNPELGKHYIDWHTENYGECGVTIMYPNQNQQFDIIIRSK